MLALQAMSEFAAQIDTKEVNMRLTISTFKPTGEVHGSKIQITLNSENYHVPQRFFVSRVHKCMFYFRNYLNKNSNSLLNLPNSFA